MANQKNSYEEMCKKPFVYEQSEVPNYDPPMQNSYEQALSSGKGFNQSGFEGK
jgi:hypothetical protein